MITTKINNEKIFLAIKLSYIISKTLYDDGNKVENKLFTNLWTLNDKWIRNSYGLLRVKGKEILFY